MADTPAAEPQGKSQFGFLTRKVGPLPVWAWAAIAVGGYYWYTHYGPGASKKAAQAQPQQRPQVVVLQDKDGRGRQGPPGPAGSQGPPGPPGRRDRTRRRRKPSFAGGPGPLGPGPPAVAEPVTVAAPMTAGDIYGEIPTASPDGSTYDSGYPSAAQLEGAYVPAG